MMRPFSMAIALTAALAEVVHAQSYPVKPLRLIVPFAAGSTTDISARFIITHQIGRAHV